MSKFAVWKRKNILILIVTGIFVLSAPIISLIMEKALMTVVGHSLMESLKMLMTVIITKVS